MRKVADAGYLGMLEDRRPVELIDTDLRTLGISKPGEEHEPTRAIPLASISVSPFQRRVPFSDEALENLVTSITQHGVITPIIVRELDGGGFELITGHRRTEACRRIGRETIPAVVRVMSDRDAAIALTADNTQHAGLSDWERYKHAAMLLDGKHVRNMTHLADVLGMSRPAVYNLKAFGDLPPTVQAMLETNPRLIGGTLAFDLRNVSGSHPDIVTEAVQLIEAEKLSQSSARQWVDKKIAPATSVVKLAPARHERSFGNTARAIRLVAVGTDVRLSGNIDVEKLAELIEANFEAVVRVSEV